MAARTCPSCFTKIPRTTIVAHSYDLVCPGCGRPLEISRISRNLAVFVALVIATAMAYVAALRAPHHHVLGWLSPFLHAIVFYGVTAALVLIYAADLSLKAEPDVQHHARADEQHGGHGASGHAAGSHDSGHH